MMETLEKQIFGYWCSAHISESAVELSLPEWSGRQPHKEAYEGLEALIDFLTEVKNEIAKAHPEGSEWLEDQSPATVTPTAIQYEVVTIAEAYTDEITAKMLSDGWEIIWQDICYSDGSPTEFDITYIIRFKRPVRSIVSTERLTSEASNTPTDFIEEVKAFFHMIDDGAVMPTTSMLYRFAYHLVQTGDTSAVNLFASRYGKYVSLASESRLAVS